MTPDSIRCGTFAAGMRVMSDLGSFMSFKTPETFVSWMNFSALSATAIFAAAVSAFML